MEIKFFDAYCSVTVQLQNRAIIKALELALIEKLREKYPDLIPLGMVHLNLCTSHLAKYVHHARDDYGYTDIILPESLQEVVNTFCKTIKFLESR